VRHKVKKSAKKTLLLDDKASDILEIKKRRKQTTNRLSIKENTGERHTGEEPRGVPFKWEKLITR